MVKTIIRIVKILKFPMLKSKKSNKKGNILVDGILDANIKFQGIAGSIPKFV